MKGERDALRDVRGTNQPEEESRTKKYLRIAVGSVLLALLAYVFVMAIIRK
jgi:hypothetical protein